MSQVDIPGLPLNTTPPSDSLFEISNSGVSESTRLQDIVFGLQETSEKDQINGYAGLDGVGQISLSAVPDLSATYQVIIDKDQPNGYAGLDAGGLLSLSVYPAGNALEFLRRNAANTALEFAATGSVSPLTTKGDIFGFDTVNARIPVGTDGQVLTANSAQALGVEYTTIVFPADTPWTVDHDAAGFNLINVTQYESNATNPAGEGAIRLGDEEAIGWRNSANDGDNLLLAEDPDLVIIGFETFASDGSVTNVDFFGATLNIDGIFLNNAASGSFNAGDRPFNSMVSITFTASGRVEELSLGNTQEISWQKAISANGWIGLSTNASDEFVIGIATSAAGATVDEYVFSNTGVSFLNNNLTLGTAYIDLGEITTPANPAVNVGRLYTKDVAAITKLFFLDSAGTETDVLASSSPLTTKGDLFTFDTGNQRLPVGADNQILVANSATATGLEWQAPAAAVQTPWVQDIDADNFDLFDISNILFQNTTGAPGGAVIAIYALSDDLRLNVDATNFVVFGTDGDTIVRIGDTGLGLPNGDDITGVGSLVFSNINNNITSDGDSVILDGFADVQIFVNGSVEYVFNTSGANFQANTLSNVTLTTSVAVDNAISWADGVKQTFNPDNTNAGINVGLNALEPSVPVNGDLFYDSTALALKARINGAWVELGAGGGASPLTTKGDLFTFTTVDARLPVGTDTQVLTANSVEATGLEWVGLSAFTSFIGFTADADLDMGAFGVIFTSDNAGIAGTNKYIANEFGTLWLNAETGSEVDFAINNVAMVSVKLDRLDLGNTTDILGALNIQFGNSAVLPSSFLRYIQYGTVPGLLINAAAADTTTLTFDAVSEYTFDATEADFNSNNLVGLNDLTLAGNIVFPDGVRQTFNPDATNSGLNVGTQSDPDPTVPVNGDIYYNTTNNKFRAREGGVWFDMIGGTGDIVGPGSSTDEAVVRFNGTTGKLAQNSIVTIDDLGNIAGQRSEQFTASNTFPAASVFYIQAGNSGGGTLDLEYNVPTASEHGWHINGTQEMNLTATDLFTMTNNIIQDSAYHQMRSISSPASSGSTQLGRIFMDLDNSDHLTISRNGVEFDLEAGGTGDVVGPGSSADTELVRFSGVTGKIIQATSVPVLMTSAGEPTWPRAILFTNFTGGLPASSSTYIQSFFSDITLNTSTGNITQFTINAVTAYTFAATVLSTINKNINIGSAYYQLTSIVSPASTGNATIGRLFLDSDNAQHLTIQRNGVEVDLESTSGQSPWVSDIEAATFDLNNLGNLNFALTGATGIPAATEPFITWDDTLIPDAMRFNVPSNQEYAFYFNAVEEYTWSVSQLDFHGNAIQNAGNIIQDAIGVPGITILGRTNEVTGQDAAEIRFQGGNTQYAEIRSNMVLATGGSERGNLILGVKVGNTTTIDDVITMIGGTTSAGTTLSFNNTPMASQIDMNGNVVNNVGDIRSDDPDEASVGFIRMGNAELIAWRNNGDSANHTITFNASDQFVIQVTTGSDYIFSETAFNLVANEIQNVGMFNFQSDIEVTIAAGVITITRSYFNIDTEGNAATDDLDTINGGVDGRVIVIKANSNARTVVVKDGTGNISCAGDFSLDNLDDTMTLMFDGTNWLEISRSDNGA